MLPYWLIQWNAAQNTIELKLGLPTEILEREISGCTTGN